MSTYNPKISICVPVYNGDAYLAECLDAILSQTYKNLEVLIVDDKSQDGSMEIVKAFAARSDKIRIFNNEKNQGLVGNWNRCIELAKGDWIKFVFQDDVLDLRCVEKLVSKSSPSDAIIVCDRVYTFEDVAPEIEVEYRGYQENMNLLAIFGGKLNISPKEVASAAIEHLGRNFIGEPTSVLLSKKAIDTYGGFNKELIHLCDIEYFMRVASNTGLVYVPESLVSFRVHGRSTSAANRDWRNFRSEVIDPLMLMHEYAFNPFFRNVRSAARAAVPPLDLRKIVGQRAHWALVKARASAVKPGGTCVEIEEWRQVLAKFPRMRTLSFWWLAANDLMTRHFLWRFHSPKAKPTNK